MPRTPGSALDRPLPLAAGDVALLRDPGAHRIVARVTVLDTAPPVLARRGAARARAGELARLEAGGRPDGAALLRERGALRAAELRSTGAAEPAGAERVGEWLVDAAAAARWRSALGTAVGAQRRRRGRGAGCAGGAGARRCSVCPTTPSCVGLVARALRRAGRPRGRHPAGTRAARARWRRPSRRCAPTSAGAVRRARCGPARRARAGAARARRRRAGGGGAAGRGRCRAAGRRRPGGRRRARRPAAAVHDQRGAAGPRDVPARDRSAARAARPSRPDPTPARRPPHRRPSSPSPIMHAAAIMHSRGIESVAIMKARAIA